MEQLRFNVVMRHWRVTFEFTDAKGSTESIIYTVEAESWNKAYLTAMPERDEIASLLGIRTDDVTIKSIVPVSAARSE